MIRTINIKDATQIQSICRSSLGYDVTVDTVKAQIQRLLEDSRHHFIFVYEDDDSKEVQGFVHAELYESLYSEKGMNILGLAVCHDCQGKGIGKQLMTYLENIALRQNVAFIRLNSSSTRTQAHLFYEKIGYSCDKTQKRFIKVFA